MVSYGSALLQRRISGTLCSLRDDRGRGERSRAAAADDAVRFGMGLFDGTPLQRPVTCERCGRVAAKQPGGSVVVGASAEEICVCPRDAGGRVSMPKDQPARVRREKRRGNWNTVVSGLAPGDAKTLVKTLRSRLGAGGTVDEKGELVLQGDHKEAVLTHLIELGYAAKGSGG